MLKNLKASLSYLTEEEKKEFGIKADMIFSLQWESNGKVLESSITLDKNSGAEQAVNRILSIIPKE